VLVPGGGHELADEVRRQWGSRVEYLRVATSNYREVAGR
jgi:hypothetical protein